MASKKKSAGQSEPWAGGRIRYDERGLPTFWIQRRFSGKRWHFSTHLHEPDSALEFLRRWEIDPHNVKPAGGDAPKPPPESQGLLFTDELAEGFLKWSEAAKHNSGGWVAKQRRFLKAWREALGEVDLRALSLTAQILPYLDNVKTSRQHRIATLKFFYSWLRKERHVVTAAEDPTFGTLTAPQGKPEQWREVKAFSREHYQSVRDAMTDATFKAAMVVQASTGWHVTETIRFAASGKVEELPESVANPDRDRVLCCPQSKSGEPLRTRVSPAAAEAALTLRAAGELDYGGYWRAMRAACEAAKLSPDAVQPGSFRHSVATWAINAGADPGQVAAFFNHKSIQTTKRFYATHAVPAKIPTLG